MGDVYDLRFVVLRGDAGCGKTAVLRALADRGCHVLDLEALTGHRGSAFGHIGLPAQPSPRAFAARLAAVFAAAQAGTGAGSDGSAASASAAWADAASAPSSASAGSATAFSGSASASAPATMYAEIEGSALGSLAVPPGLVAALAAADHVLLRDTLPRRVARIAAAYHTAPRADLIAALARLQSRLGSRPDADLGRAAAVAQAALLDGDLPRAIAAILPYYDRAYAHQLARCPGRLLATLDVADHPPADLAARCAAYR